MWAICPGTEEENVYSYRSLFWYTLRFKLISCRSRHPTKSLLPISFLLLGPWISTHPHDPQHLTPFQVLTYQAKDWVKATKLSKLIAERNGNMTEPHSTLRAGNVSDNIKAKRFGRDGIISVHWGMNYIWSCALQQCAVLKLKLIIIKLIYGLTQ